MEQANLALSRTELRAPFDARVKLVQVEVGQNVAPGVIAVVLANDATMEISVPLEGREASQWLRFEEATAKQSYEIASDLQWFGIPEAVRCRITWAEDPGQHEWWGVLHRIERCDQVTRTVSVCIRVDGEKAGAAKTGMPLVEGMFCKVEIPGKVIAKAYRMPRWVVTFEGDIYLAEESPEGPRLARRKVEVVRRQGEEVFVRGGLVPGDRVIFTRLQTPLPGTLLEIEAPLRTDSNAEQASAEAGVEEVAGS